MYISVFENISLPKSKEDKKYLSKYASRPHYPCVHECRDIKDLIKLITSYGWSPNIFKEFRLQSEFKHTDFLVLDIDDGLSISEAFSRIEVNDLMCICLPTSSHTKDHNRFRLIFPLAKTIYKSDEYIHNMESLYELFPESDRQCITDTARFYFGCILSDDGFVYEGDLYVPEEVIKQPTINRKSNASIPITEDIQGLIKRIYEDDRDSIPEAVDYFVKNAHTGLSGEWNTSLNSFCFTLGLQEIDFDVVYQIVEELAPEELDQNDEYTINRGYQHGSESRSGVDERSGSVDRKSNIPKW